MLWRQVKKTVLVLTLKKQIAKLFLSRFFIYNFTSYLHYNWFLRSFDLYRHFIFIVIFINTAILNYISVFMYTLFTAILIYTANLINITILIYTANLIFFHFDLNRPFDTAIWFIPSFWIFPPFWNGWFLNCLGMLVELKLLKRQDLVGVIANALKPANDQLHIRWLTIQSTTFTEWNNFTEIIIIYLNY